MASDKTTSSNVDPHDFLAQLAKDKQLDLLDQKLATELDEKDELKQFRDRFYFPIVEDPSSKMNGQDFLYFTGNSLGLQPKTTKKYIEEELDVWRHAGVEGHFKHSKNRPWLTTDEYVLDQMARIVGAEKEEVVVMNSLTVNLHLMMVPFYRPTKDRYKILIEAHAFPSDLYAVQCQIKYHGFDPSEALIQLAPRANEHTLRLDDILECIQSNGDQIALILFSGVQYYTGQYFDIKTITAAGQAKGCRVGWDLAHAVGNVDLQLHNWNVDFACWCSYKYLNSGPGNIAGSFIHKRNGQDLSLPRFSGWWSHELSTRFAMDEPELRAIPGAFGFRCSNPPVVCVAALLASVEIFDEAKIEKLRNKSKVLTTYLEMLVKRELAGKLKVITPENVWERGCQLSLLFSVNVADINEELMKRGVLCDVRKPNVIRVAPTPLYNRFEDVRQFVVILKSVLEDLKI